MCGGTFFFPPLRGQRFRYTSAVSGTSGLSRSGRSLPFIVCRSAWRALPLVAESLHVLSVSGELRYRLLKGHGSRQVHRRGRGAKSQTGRETGFVAAFPQLHGGDGQGSPLVSRYFSTTADSRHPRTALSPTVFLPASPFFFFKKREPFLIRKGFFRTAPQAGKNAGMPWDTSVFACNTRMLCHGMTIL